ncbi:MAG: MBL fold metallo-hydrolase [Rhizobiaceae bacterium]
MSKKVFQARFWGARGTLASISKDTTKYGGNTACVEITCGDNQLIFDAGTGLRILGSKIARDTEKELAKGRSRKTMNLFFTHCHYDHIAGLPFFAPFYDSKNSINIWSGHLDGPDKTKRMIENYMSPPYFPVGPEVFSAKLDYRDFEPGDVLKPMQGVKIKTLSLNHHDECIGYRVDFDGRSICYITDTTHIAGQLDQRIVEFVKDADLMIYDGTYTDAEFPQFWNFGHSTWQEGVRISKAANVKRYCIFHHRPSRTDKAMDAITTRCKKQFRRSWAAREGLVIKV